MILLKKRRILEISGQDVENFLQKIISQDVKKAEDGAYSLLLTPNGRYLADFFIFLSQRYCESIFVDIDASLIDVFLLNIDKYKFRADVVVKITDFNVCASINNENLDYPENDSTTIAAFRDPRKECMGQRLICDGSNGGYDVQEAYEDYEVLRIRNTLPDAADFIAERSIPIEYNMKNLNAIAFGKGCYVGQEFTNRTHTSAVVRKKLATIDVSRIDGISVVDVDRDLECVLSQIKSAAQLDDDEIILKSYAHDGKFTSIALVIAPIRLIGEVFIFDGRVCKIF